LASGPAAAGPVLSFTTRYGGRASVLTNDVHVGRPVVDRAKPVVSLEDCGAKKFVAIWDTGATNCVITQKVIDQCNLPPITRVKVNTVSGEEETTVHLASLFLPNKLMLPVVRFTKGKLAGGDVLIGMDVIGSGDFAVTNTNGKTTLSFRQPSLEEIDFTRSAPEQEAPTRRVTSKIGRNDLCPCGSGKKYKRCHGLATDTPPGLHPVTAKES
jgi:predicted aspartyl protease